MTYSRNTKTYKQRNPQSVTTKVNKRQVKNDSGAYVYQTNDWDQLKRFLILGTTAPTYHAGTRNVGRNVALVEKMVRKDGLKVVELVLQMDRDNRLIRKNQALFVLAYALKKGNRETRKFVSTNVTKIVRTGRDLATFVAEVNDLGGWGRLTRNAVASWYAQEVDRLGYQVVKYRNTGQYSHRNVLRLCHATPMTEEHNNLLRYLVGKEYDEKQLPKQVRQFVKIQRQANNGKLTEEKLVAKIRKHRLTHEMVPTQFKNSVAVWEALAETMPFRATVWNLGTFSRLGMLKRFSGFEKMIVSRLENAEQVKRSRIHPFTLLVAIRNYSKGRGHRNTWDVNQRVVEALEVALDHSLDAVEDTGKRLALIVDTSGSMGWGNVAGSDMMPREVAGAMAAVQTRQADTLVLGVDSRLQHLNISKRSRISDVMRELNRYNGGSTNLGLGIKHLIAHKIEVDAIVYYTDNQVNRGEHVAQLFDEYRRRVNKDAKFICVGMTMNNFTVADPKRNDMLDIAGFDPTAAQVIDSFVEGF